MSKLRRVAGVTVGSAATVALVIDAIGRMQTAEQLLPATVTKYLPVAYLTGFVAALVMMREQQKETGSPSESRALLIFGIPNNPEFTFYLRNDGTQTACNVRIETMPGRFGFISFDAPRDIPPDRTARHVNGWYDGPTVSGATTLLSLTLFNGLRDLPGVQDEGRAAVAEGRSVDFRVAVTIAYDSLLSGEHHEDRFDVVHRFSPTKRSEFFVERILAAP